VQERPRGILKSPPRRKRDDGHASTEEDGVPRKKVRFRHRVRCVFKSEEGRRKFREAVERL
jgi:hypothetical protein